MSDVKLLQQERTKLFHDLYDGKIPKRVPVNANMGVEFCIQYAGLPLAKTQWTMEGVEEAMDRACQITGSDGYPFGFTRFPAPLQILGSKFSVMGSDGFIQHPEVTVMEADEYDELIKNPYDFIMEKALPRTYPELDTDPVTRSLVFAKAAKAFFDSMDEYAKIDAKLSEKYGFYVTPPESVGMALAPFDFIADVLRGFKGISMDVRRCPEKVAEACEALLPLTLKRAIPPVPSKYGQTFMPLHMATFLRESDFEKLYWPTFSRTVQALADVGQPVFMFCEHNWMRYLDYLYELPENTRIAFEFGDPKLVKQKLGKRHILSGLYPMTYLKTATKQQCIDKAKELLDIMAPGGRYYFDFDKSLISLDTANVENYEAVTRYVAENSYYSNAGEPADCDENAGKKFIETGDIKPFKSKYYKTWEEYKAEHPEIPADLEPVIAQKLQMYEEMFFMLF
ncbi:uroporphyrinogen decarboxylase family protein [Calorimonas adulescens]|jgi:Uroporphyrinogen decarboxylase (URO-D).|uniref:Uroporphyrinogen decarboxylase n=1 Tax=Calorimonas adulescens TaxID=2606906 RepID=A0A5D8Q8A6_9THEO|nr:uroporphyrinogen decarboxylase family protein [Calorimonas adulescens]TZE80617.1 uroporphyrinogen decarboxylase [Calorimonas adulescens]